MAAEVKRERARKKIHLPSGGDVYIPVLTRVVFLDQNGQETEQSIENTSDGNREVHTDTVHSSVPASGSIDVERIDVWKVTDLPDRAQETHVLLDNVTGADATPPSFTTHLKRHVFRYYLDPNNPDDHGAWVDSELIDEFTVLDQRGMEDHFFLLNPAKGDPAGQADPNDPEISSESPYRTDPYQNIVDFSGGPPPTGHGTVRVGVLIGASVTNTGQFNSFGSGGGAGEINGIDGTYELRTGVFNTSTNSWSFGQFPSLTGAVSGCPPSQGGQRFGTGPGNYQGYYSLTSSGIGTFGITKDGSDFLGPFGPIDFSGMTFDVDSRHYTFDSMIIGEHDSASASLGIVLATDVSF